MKNYDYIYDIFKEILQLNYKINYKELLDIDLYPGQPILLETIFEKEGITQSELSNLSLKKPATITTMINRLENIGYIKRVSDINDKRIIRLYLTDLGKEKYYQLLNLKRTMSNNIFKGMSDEDISNVYNLLLKIKNNLEKI